MHVNHSFVERHVNTLLDKTVQSDCRYEPVNRCQAGAPDATIARLLEKVDIERQGKLQNYQTNKPNDLVLDVPSVVITLEAGQHRTAAVLRLDGLPVHSSTGVFLD